MHRYILRRLLYNIPVLIGVTIIIFAMIEIAPGDAADYYVNPEMEITQESMARLRERFGLDDPAPVRYVKWVTKVLQGDLGYRYVNGRPVADVIFRRLGATVRLIGAALGFGAVVGISLGVFTGLHQYSFWDFTLTGLSFVFVSMPAFIAGIFGLYIFSIKLNWFPSGGMRTVTEDPSLRDSLHHLILPSFILSLMYIAKFMRYMRFSLLEVLHATYIQAARGKGLRERVVIWRHMVPNAILPVVTVIGLSMQNLVVGAVFIETVYSWPGMGTLYLDAVQGRDVPLLMGMNLIMALVILTANLITDISYSLVDPRIRYD